MREDGDILGELKFTNEEVEMAKKILAIEMLERDNSIYRMEDLLHLDPEMRFGSLERILEAIKELELQDINEYASQVLNLEEMRRVAVR